MSRRAIGLALAVALAVTAIGCQKLPGRPQGAVAPAETLSRPDAIPAAWGNLVAVSANDQYPDIVALWFQDDQKVIRLVYMRPATGELLSARVIRRN